MRFDILTLFPENFNAIKSSILARAENKGIIEINLVNFRDYSKCKHKKVDDAPYGGGEGMLLACQPIIDAIRNLDPERKARRIFLSPKGKRFNQQEAVRLTGYDHAILLCGHYEGIDERIIKLEIDEQISLGDFVLTGGEIPAMAVIDAVSRLVPGVLTGNSNFENESFMNGKLEHPQYTRPEIFEGLEVPKVLLSGNHAEIEKWKRENSEDI